MGDGGEEEQGGNRATSSQSCTLMGFVIFHLRVSLRGAGFSCPTWRGAFRGLPRDALELARQSAGPRFKTTGIAKDRSQRRRALRRPPPSSAKDVATFWYTIGAPLLPARHLALRPQIEAHLCHHVGLPTT